MAKRLRSIFGEPISCRQNIGVYQEPKGASCEAYVSRWVYRFFTVIRNKLWWQICVYRLTVYRMIPGVTRFCPCRASNGLNYITQGVASLALGYGQVALSGRCRYMKPIKKCCRLLVGQRLCKTVNSLRIKRVGETSLAIWCQQFQLVSDTNQFVPFFLELCFHVTSNYIYMLGCPVSRSKWGHRGWCLWFVSALTVRASESRASSLPWMLCRAQPNLSERKGQPVHLGFLVRPLRTHTKKLEYRPPEHLCPPFLTVAPKKDGNLRRDKDKEF